MLQVITTSNAQMPPGALAIWDSQLPLSPSSSLPPFWDNKTFFFSHLECYYVLFCRVVPTFCASLLLNHPANRVALSKPPRLAVSYLCLLYRTNRAPRSTARPVGCINELALDIHLYLFPMFQCHFAPQTILLFLTYVPRDSLLTLSQSGSE